MQAILSKAYHLLQERAARIGDEELRRSFLENGAAHRAIVEEIQRMMNHISFLPSLLSPSRQVSSCRHRLHKSAILQISKRLLDLLPRVHDERAVASDRLIQWLARNE